MERVCHGVAARERPRVTLCLRERAKRQLGNDSERGFKRASVCHSPAELHWACLFHRACLWERLGPPLCEQRPHRGRHNERKRLRSFFQLARRHWKRGNNAIPGCNGEPLLYGARVPPKQRQQRGERGSGRVALQQLFRERVAALL